MALASDPSMQRLTRRTFLECSGIATGAWLMGSRQLSAAVLPGLETVVPPSLSGEEVTGQPDIWALEVRFKPMRMIHTDLTDPKTGRTSRQLVWYLAYRAVTRSTSRVPTPESEKGWRSALVPEFTFVTEDGGKQQVYPDRILPQAVAAINRRERHAYKNSVEIDDRLPPLTPDNSKSLNAVDGVATWTGIDPNTDFFTVYMGGFSNGYKMQKGPDDQEIVLKRTIVQKFWRPSDRFDQSEDEIRLKGEPSWIYR